MNKFENLDKWTFISETNIETTSRRNRKIKMKQTIQKWQEN